MSNRYYLTTMKLEGEFLPKQSQNLIAANTLFAAHMFETLAFEEADNVSNSKERLCHDISKEKW
jgi:hypothetical protein